MTFYNPKKKSITEPSISLNMEYRKTHSSCKTEILYPFFVSKPT
ncbi:hypothetical protein IX324_003059 [Bacteroides pyogenes]|nr:hypothetical protein [Bacteroides pyogenes]